MPEAGNAGGSRMLLRRLREIMETGTEAQERLNRLVAMVAATMVADVCSIYLTRGNFHELFATQGLSPDAVHRTRLKQNEGLVGLVAETAQPLNLADAPQHDRFSYRPETGEEKRAVLEHTLNDASSNAPIARLYAQRAPETFWAE